MRKILIACFVFAATLAFPKTVHAACDYVRDGNNICINHFTDCLLVTGSGACCDTANECPSVPTPTPTSPPSPPPPGACDYIRDGNNICINHFVDCLFVTGSGACCDTADECPSPPTPTPTQPPPPVPPVPGGGCADPNEINTAIGCINVSNPTSFVKSILGLAIGIGGGIAFLLMLFGAFQIMTSQGDPERLKAGKELIGSALAGLLMIIFSVFLLQLIGVQILQIPGLSK